MSVAKELQLSKEEAHGDTEEKDRKAEHGT